MNSKTGIVHNNHSNNNHGSEWLSLTTYVVTQLQEIICMGPGHALTWASNKEHQPLQRVVQSGRAYNWLQVSVQGGEGCHLMIQFVLPEGLEDVSRPCMDTLFMQYGWTHEQADGRECLVYYVGQSADARTLLDQSEDFAAQCVEVMGRLWQARTLEDIALLGARGPRLSHHAQSMPARPQQAAAEYARLSA